MRETKSIVNNPEIFKHVVEVLNFNNIGFKISGNHSFKAWGVDLGRPPKDYDIVVEKEDFSKIKEIFDPFPSPNSKMALPTFKFDLKTDLDYIDDTNQIRIEVFGVGFDFFQTLLAFSEMKDYHVKVKEIDGMNLCVLHPVYSVFKKVEYVQTYLKLVTETSLYCSDNTLKGLQKSLGDINLYFKNLYEGDYYWLKEKLDKKNKNSFKQNVIDSFFSIKINS